MRKLGWVVGLIGLLFFSMSCDNPTESRSNPYEQHPIDWPSLADSPWPMYRHDPQLTGRSNYSLPQNGEIIWSIVKPGVRSGAAFTAFAIGQDSTIYFGSSYEPYNDYKSWCIYAITSEGQVKWKYQDSDAEAYMTTGILITADNKIIFGTPGKRGNGYVYALDKSGQLIWRFVTEGKVYLMGINIDTYGNLYFNDKCGNVYSIDKNGNLRWKVSSNSDLMANFELGMPISPDGNTLYVANYNYKKSRTILTAISIDGSIKWTYKIEDSSAFIYTTPVVDFQGNIYMLITNSPHDTTKSGLYSLSPDGKLRWRYLSRVNSWSEFTIDWNGNIIVYMDYSLYSIRNNGELRFRVDIADYITAPLISDRNNNILAISSVLYCFNSEGMMLYQINLPCEVWADGALDNQGNFYLGVPCDENRIVKIN